MLNDLRIEALVAGDAADAAAGLLARFFAEEGFATPPAQVVCNLGTMLADPMCWGALATLAGKPVGIVTVTTMRYVEWGLLGEIGDLYVLPEHRRAGVASALVAAAMGWCCDRGCTAVSVTITPPGEAQHGLSRFYERFGFRSGGRTILTARFA